MGCVCVFCSVSNGFLNFLIPVTRAKIHHRTNNKWSFRLDMTNWSIRQIIIMKEKTTATATATTYTPSRMNWQHFPYTSTIFKCLLHVCNFHRTWIINHIFFARCNIFSCRVFFILFGSIYPHHSQTCTLSLGKPRTQLNWAEPNHPTGTHQKLQWK